MASAVRALRLYSDTAKSEPPQRNTQKRKRQVHAKKGRCWCFLITRGRQKKSTDTPRAFALSATYLPTYLPTFFGAVFSTFLGVSRYLGKGSSKTPEKVLSQKVHVENFSPKNRQNFDVSFSSTFFGVYRVFGYSVQKQKNIEKNKFDPGPWSFFGL
jgi:hypothetical protein